MIESCARRRGCISLAFYAAICCAFPALQANTNENLIEALQQGGHIVYLRHAATDHDTRDSERSDLSDCSKQRNLSPSGKAQARAINRGIKHLGIPIGQVYSSPYCRCKETARLAFGDFTIENDLQFSISKDREEAQRLGRRLRDMMLQIPESPENTVFVGHTANLRDGLGVWPKPEGVMVIFKRQGSELKLRGMIHPDRWQDGFTASVE